MAAFPFITTQAISLLASATAGGEAGPHAEGDHGHEGVSPKALPLFRFPGMPEWMPDITNAILVAFIVTFLITWFMRSAMKKATLVPGKKQNFVEWLVELLYTQVENILGPKVTKKAFPLLGTIFIFILATNYFGLLPGVGTVGLTEHANSYFSVSHPERPFLRPATADMNMTIGIALVSTLVWFIITMSEVGIWGFLKHTFGPKGGLKGLMGLLVAIIFFVVGIIEVVGIVFRPVSLSFRLYGNIFAGETLLHTMSSLVGGHPIVRFICSVLLPLPFYFLELLVGLLQAMVFTLLSAVYIQLSTAHDDHGEGEHAH